MTIAELLAFDVAPAVAPLHIELSKDELTQYSTLSSTRGRREGKQLLTSKLNSPSNLQPPRSLL
ncbi:BQ5605_C017g08367 [Microbotryum silenes-dioicae]|uniref:BQ5605_C017g08367 protein n=1 Tax=Microbotryum silenes-dioicae TaxID=796604 RepID=A0A2X0LUI1_9BASI|nr:BQ5605_C017g08367 [Microbotryum silenes-dioicae]